jgi:tetratricopeptide (TPR) repeat protein
VKPLLLFFLLLAATLHAADDAFTAANRAFAEGKTDAALAGYEGLLKQGASAPLLFNLGNAYAKNGQVGQALLAYDRARLLAPRDPDLEANRSYTLHHANLPAPGTTAERLAETLSPNEWAWLLVAAVTAACAGGFTLYARPGVPLRVATGAMVLGAAIALGGLGLRQGGLHRAYVVVPEATVRLSPFAEAQTAFSLPDGTPVQVEAAHDDFLRIRTAKGETGWVRRGEAEPLLP